MILSRRSLITGFAALLAAPAIVRAGSLMPIKTDPIAHVVHRVHVTDGSGLIRFVDGRVEKMGGWERYVGDGSRERPFATITEGLASLDHEGGGTVVVLPGVYKT